MSENESLPLDLREVEARLASLAPAPPRLDRDRLMYEAGRAAGLLEPTRSVLPSSARTWKRATFALAACLAIAASLAVHAYTTRPDNQQNIVYVKQTEEAHPAPAATGERAARADASDEMPEPVVRSEPWTSASELAQQEGPSHSAYLYQRNLVLREGVDALPLSQSGAVEPRPAPTVRELLEEFMLSDPYRRPDPASEI